MINFRIKECVNSTENNNTCETPENIRKKKNGGYAMLMTSLSNFNSQKIPYPFEKEIMNFMSPVYENFTSQSFLYLSNSYAKISENFWYFSKKEKEYRGLEFHSKEN